MGCVILVQHLLGVGAGGLLNLGMYTELLQAVLCAGLVVEGKNLHLLLVEEDLSAAAPLHVASVRGVGGLRVQSRDARRCGASEENRT